MAQTGRRLWRAHRVRGNRHALTVGWHGSSGPWDSSVKKTSRSSGTILPVSLCSRAFQVLVCVLVITGGKGLPELTYTETTSHGDAEAK